MRIADWPTDERPRERLLAHGAAALSEAELLAIFLRTGIAGSSAVELARDLLARFGGLTGCSAPRSIDIRGDPRLRPGEIRRNCRRSSRSRAAALCEEIGQRDALTSPHAVRDYLRAVARQPAARSLRGAVSRPQNRLLGPKSFFAAR